MFDLTRTLPIPLIITGVYLWRSLMLKHWIVDDAAISFSYARSVAHGYGLVSQPGMTPVEGFSNFLWMIIQAPWFWLRSFDPYITPKTLSVLCVLGAFICLYRLMCRQFDLSQLAAGAVLFCIALNSSFVVWTSSGLENALLVFLVVLLTYLLVQWNGGSGGYGKTATLGLVAGLISLTRPDGAAYLLAFPAILIYSLFRSDRPRIVELAKYFGSYAAPACLIFGGYLLFRHWYFGEWFPNTYYVKGGPSFQGVLDTLFLRNESLSKWQTLLQGVAGKTLWLPIWLVLLGGTICAFGARKEKPGLAVPFLICFLAGMVHLVMPDDYMREFRFATTFFPMLYVSVGVGLVIILRKWIQSATLRITVGTTLAIAALGWTWRHHNPRLLEFSRWPTVSFARIGNEYGRRYDRYAEQLRITEASVLLPDIGGPLFYSDLRVYDLAGLCDTTIARTRGVNQQSFYDYIFGTVKPTFMHTHGFFSAVSKFEGDPRFRADYEPIYEKEEPYYNSKVLDGDYVRKDRVAGREDELKKIQDSLAAGR